MDLYKLAKQLKEAGFRQNEANFFYKERGNIFIPSLPELIIACGKRTVLHSPGSLDTNEECFMPSSDEWTAFSQLKKRVQANGKTPEEAFARLYLKLSKIEERKETLLAELKELEE